MDRQELKKGILEIVPRDKLIYSRQTIIKKYPHIYSEILEVTEYLNGDTTFSERLYHIMFDLFDIVKCKLCDKQVNFSGFNRGYCTYCSIGCGKKDPSLKEKYKQTCLKKYGVDSPFKSKLVKEKIKQTCLDKYGVDNPLKSEEVKEKIKQTCLDKYGVEYHLQSKETKEKIKQTCLDKYGVDAPFKSKEIKGKIKQTYLDKYGVDNPFKSETVKEKIKQTCLDKYGVNHPSKTEEVKEKKKQTCLDNYGVDNPFKSEEVKEKFKQTMLSKYGVDNPFKSEEVKEKYKQTMLSKYGVDSPSKVEEVRKKISKTNKEKFSKRLEKYLIENDLELADDYFNSCSKQIWKCTKCNETFEQIWNSIQQGYLCPTCYPIVSGTSKQELEIFEFVKEILPDEEILNGCRKIIPPKELDIYIPNKKITIEFNGLYWHSDKFGDSKYHLNKTEECEKQGIQLIHIFEDEWIFKKEIVKSRLSNLLGTVSKRIYARKCIIKVIEPRTKNQFLEQNHIQGKDNSTIKLGAFCENELVSVMTFSKGNISKGSKAIEGIWELNRFCSKLNYHITGIASKLLSHFKRNYEWKEIFSYADRRWSVGNVYEKLGFELSHITDPNYWYIKGFKRIHRFSLRKRPDEPKDIPEWYLREQEGYTRIWDCGNLKFGMRNE